MGFLNKLLGGSSSSSSTAPVTTSSNYEDSRIGVSDAGQAATFGAVAAKDQAVVLGQDAILGQAIGDLAEGSTASIVTNDPTAALAAIKAATETTQNTLQANAAVSDKALSEAYNAVNWQQNFATETQARAEDTVKKSIDAVKELALPASERGLGNIATLAAAVLVVWLVFKKQ